MTVHLQKLCVGCDSVEDLAAWVAERMAERRRQGRSLEQVHRTRMMPKQVADLLDGGSLFWVIKGSIQVRQPLLDLREVVGEDGITRCELVMEPELVRVEPQPRRPFQGWRYLPAADAPADLRSHAGGDLPPRLVTELRALGLW